jgi:hypothetical protein
MSFGGHGREAKIAVGKVDALVGPQLHRLQVQLLGDSDENPKVLHLLDDPADLAVVEPDRSPGRTSSNTSGIVQPIVAGPEDLSPRCRRSPAASGLRSRVRISRIALLQERNHFHMAAIRRRGLHVRSSCRCHARRRNGARE